MYGLSTIAEVALAEQPIPFVLPPVEPPKVGHKLESDYSKRKQLSRLIIGRR